MKQITTHFRHIYRKMLLVTAMFLVIVLCSVRYGVAQRSAGTSVGVDTVSPQPSQDKQLQVYKFNAEIPQFPGGEEALMKYLSEHIHYPKAAIENKIQGTVIVQFVVGADGKLRDITTVGVKIGGGLEQEAIRVIKEMPDWIPGRHNGQKVSIQYKLPINFTL